jgi:hypothetical protein
MPQRESERCFRILIKLKMVLRTSTERMFAMTSYDKQDNSFPYPLVGGLVGTIVSLAGVWIFSALFAFGPVVGA